MEFVRILVAAVGTPGHAFPLVPLALALRDAGHDVTFSAGPDVRQHVAAAGLDFATSGIGLRAARDKSMAARGLTGRPTDPALVGSVFSDVFGGILPRAVIGDLVPLLERDRPDLVIAETGDPGAALAAARCGVPCVTHSFGRRPDGAMRLLLGGRLSPPLVEVADELGVRMAPDAPLGHACLDICPPSLQAPPDEADCPVAIPLRPTPWNPVPDSRLQRPDSGRPWVYLTLGTAMGEARVLRAAAEGLARLDVDILLASGSVDVAELGDIAGHDGRVRVEAFVPQADLLDQFALVVHHGGSGTTLGTAGAGVPQLFLPQGADQFANAAAVSAVGAGRALLDREVSADAVEDVARTLLTAGSAQEAARVLAAEIAAMPAPADVAARVEEWSVPG